MQTHWLPRALRAQATATPSSTVKDFDVRDERVVGLVEAVGSCLKELDVRGCGRLCAGDVKCLLRWISAPSKLEPTTPEIVALSLLILA